MNEIRPVRRLTARLNRSQMSCEKMPTTQGFISDLETIFFRKWSGIDVFRTSFTNQGNRDYHTDIYRTKSGLSLPLVEARRIRADNPQWSVPIRATSRSIRGVRNPLLTSSTR